MELAFFHDLSLGLINEKTLLNRDLKDFSKCTKKAECIFLFKQTGAIFLNRKRNVSFFRVLNSYLFLVFMKSETLFGWRGGVSFSGPTIGFIFVLGG